ncbi:zinc-dependent metalloprotease [Bdellovibrio bacteriovorus]|nr:zinc-dependent metalloprotease [Bdellovibrio bacteriovorus]
MLSWSRSTFAMLLCSSMLVACSKETEKIIVKDSLPPGKIEASAKVSKNHVTFEKSSLGKLFMLVPTVIESSRSAAPSFFRPQLISFERNGDRIAIFNQTVKDVVETVTADQLIQSFAIVDETADQVVFDMGQGFLSMNLQESMEIVLPYTYSDVIERGERKLESHLDIKDSYVSSLSLRNNSIFMKQVIRVVEKSREAGEANKEAEEKMKQIGMKKPEKFETSKTLFFEIKPYLQNDEFKSKPMDAQNRFGFFVNNTFKKDEDNMKTQIIRWNTDEKAGDIRVLIDANVPKKMEAAVREGVTYWNRVLGRDVLKIETGYKDSDPQTDRSIVIRWIHWDNGFGAYANTQVDPLTGEAFRGFVYMTSSFTKKEDMTGGGQNDLFSFKHGDLCGMRVDMNQPDQEDNVRAVIAHEMGHVLGLRHNFAGSSSVDHTDEEIKETLEQRAKGNLVIEKAVVTTVMDYTDNAASLASGAFIKDKIMPYDQKAIDWAYKGIESVKSKGMYCSDEHILEAGTGGRTIIGCDRQDKYRNVFFAEREKILSSAKDSLNGTISSLEYMKKAGYKIEHKAYVQVTFNPSLEIAELLYKSDKKNPLLTIADVVEDYITPYMRWGYNGKDFNSGSTTGDAEISEQLKEVGGLTAYLKSLSPTVNDPEFFQNLAKEALAAGKFDKIGLTPEELVVVKEGLLENSAKLDAEATDLAMKAIDVNKLRDTITNR